MRRIHDQKARPKVLKFLFFEPVKRSTLLVLIDFCPFQSKLFTWSSVTKFFDILPEFIIEYQIQA